jgi:hypothetical protein
VGSHGVVVAAEPVQLSLQVVQSVGWWRGGQPLLLGLVEAFDLAAGLRVVGPAVVELHPEQVEFDLEADPATAAGFAGEDRTVVAEHPCRHAVLPERHAKAGEHVAAAGRDPGLGQ